MRLAVGEEPVWSDRRGSRSATSKRPIGIRHTGEKVPMARKFEKCEVVTAEGTYDLAIPKRDAELVQYAFDLS